MKFRRARRARLDARAPAARADPRAPAARAAAAPRAPAARPDPRAPAALALALATLLTAALPAQAHARPPAVAARAAILLDADTGQVLYARNSHRRVPIASTTKLMTALLTLERAPLSHLETVVYYPATDIESTAGLRAGERMSVRDLMRAMLLASANEAAQTVAVRLGGSVRSFVRAMNARAQALGLTDTHYATPVGLDVPGNYSTASDLVQLAVIDMRNPFFARTVAMPSAHLTTGAHPRTVVNRNDLVGRYPFVDGVKTGHTSQAGYVLVGAARRGNVHLLSAVLGDPSLGARDADTLGLLRYGLAHFRTATLINAGQPLAHPTIRYAGGHATLVAATTVRRTIPVNARPQLTIEAVPARLTGPIPAGAHEGTVVITDGPRTLARVPLVTARALPKPTLGQRLRDYASHTLTVVLLAALLGCSLLLAILQRRVTRRPPGRAARRAGADNG